MKIATKRENGVVIIVLDGDLTIGKGETKLRNKIKELLEDGEKDILINLKDIFMIDSSGIGALLFAKSATNRAGGTVKLLHVKDKVLEVLEITRIIGVFETFDTEDNGIASFA
ncbi:MAG: STAS domain-containing protein [Bacteroidota bacterium]